MSFPTTCPQCLTSYRLPERQAGLRVRCKYCTATFLAQEAAEPAKKRDETPFVEEVADHFKQTTKKPPYEHFQQEDRDRRLHLARGDEQADTGSAGGSGLVVGIVASVAVLLVLAGAMAWFLAASPEAPGTPTPPVVAVDPPPPIVAGAPPEGRNPLGPSREVEPAIGPRDVASALVLLQADAAGKKLALGWLKTARVEEARREEVATALNSALEDAELRQQALPVVARWGGKPNAEKLVALLDEPTTLAWSPVVEILVKMEDDRALAAVSRQLLTLDRRAQVAQLLRAAWPRTAEKHVVKYLHHPEGPIREEAQRLLTHYGTGGAVLVEQSRRDLEGKDPRTRRAACEWLAKQRPGEEDQERIARDLARRLEDDDPFVKVTAMAALDRWATKDNVKAVCAAMQHAVLQPGALKILARLKAEESIGPLVEYLLSPSARDVAALLIAFGSKAERPTWRQLENKVPDVRVLACVILGEVGGQESVGKLQQFAKTYPAQKKVAQAAIQKIQGRTK